MTRDELDADSKLGESSFGRKTPAPSEGTRFTIPSLGEDVGGKVLRYELPDYTMAAAMYYTMRTERAESDEDRVRVYAKGSIVLLLDWAVPESQAAAYEKVFRGIEVDSPTPSTDSSSEGRK